MWPHAGRPLAWKSVRPLHPDLLNLGHSRPLEGLPTGRGRSAAGQRGDPLRWPRTFKPQASPQPGHQEPPPTLGPLGKHLFINRNIGEWGGVQQNSLPKPMTPRATVILPTLPRGRAEPPKPLLERMPVSLQKTTCLCQQRSPNKQYKTPLCTALSIPLSLHLCSSPEAMPIPRGGNGDPRGEETSETQRGWSQATCAVPPAPGWAIGVRGEPAAPNTRKRFEVPQVPPITAGAELLPLLLPTS